ncbi:MAG: SGNH/GDSL hydrolase family protein [Chitinophagaceae bacterium]
MKRKIVWIIAACFCLLFSTGEACKKQNMMNANKNNSYTYLALGDSYTIGESVAENQRFPAQTSALLQKENININSIKYIAKTGWTTIDLQNAINAQNLHQTFDIVSLLIGVNDQYQGMDSSEYRIRFTQLLQKSIQLASNKLSHVFVLSIPDYSVTPFAANSDTVRIRREIDEFNFINKQITLSYNISYINITPLTKNMKNDASLIASDGLHPSAKEYANWALLLSPVMKQILQ